MTLSAAIPGYDPDFFGPDLSGRTHLGPRGRGAPPFGIDLAPGADVAGKIGAAAGGGGGGPISSQMPGFGPSTSGLTATAVDYAYKCGQGASTYRCYGIGKVSHATLVDLQHQINRLRGGKVIAEDGIIGPATWNAAKLLGAAAAVLGFQITVPTSIDQMAANAPQLVRQYKAVADQKYGPESIAKQTEQLISSISSAAHATAGELAHDKAAGIVPQGFTQDSVRASQNAIGDIAARLGAAAAAAAAAADQVGSSAGPVGGGRNLALYIGVGVGLTAAAALTIVLIARSGRKSRS